MRTHRTAGFGTIGIIAIIAIVAGGGYVLMQAGGTATNESTDTSPSTVYDTISNAEAVVADAVAGVEGVNDESMEKMAAEEAHMSEDMPENIDKTEMQSEVAITSGTFQAYSEEKLALATTGDVVLFFHASWCPSCRGLENDINANLSSIPAGTHILKLDYDTETELKKKYDVVRQHTLIQVDQNGEVVKRLTGLTNTLSQVTKQLTN